MAQGIYVWPGWNIGDFGSMSTGFYNPADPYNSSAKQPDELANYATAPVPSQSTWWFEVDITEPGIYYLGMDLSGFYSWAYGDPHVVDSTMVRTGMAAYLGGTSAASPGTKIYDRYQVHGFQDYDEVTYWTSDGSWPPPLSDNFAVTAADLAAAGGTVKLHLVWEAYGDLVPPNVHGFPDYQAQAGFDHRLPYPTTLSCDHVDGTEMFLRIQTPTVMENQHYLVQWADGSSDDYYFPRGPGPDYAVDEVVSHVYAGGWSYGSLHDGSRAFEDYGAPVIMTVQTQQDADVYSSKNFHLPYPYLGPIAVNPRNGQLPLHVDLSVTDSSGPVPPGDERTFDWSIGTWTDTTAVRTDSHTVTEDPPLTTKVVLTNWIGHYESRLTGVPNIIELPEEPPPLASGGSGWVVGGVAWGAGAVIPPEALGPVLNLNATIAHEPAERAWRDWGWDPPATGVPVGYTSRVREVTYEGGDLNDWNSYGLGPEIVSYFGTSFPVITPHNLATSDAGHTGQGSLQDSITLEPSGYYGGISRTVVMEVFPHSADDIGPPSRTVSRVTFAELGTVEDLEASWTVAAAAPQIRWWGWKPPSVGPSPVLSYTSRVYEAVYDGVGGFHDPGAYSRGSLLYTHTEPPSDLLTFVPDDAAAGVNEDRSANPNRGRGLLMDTYSIPHSGGTERYRMICIEVVVNYAEGASPVYQVFSDGWVS